jgi:undecaprenyl phosphate N,N'-diacetylbacillosamine 1-phosphate transferase
MYKNIPKRLIDVFLSSVLLCAVTPVLIISTVAIFFSSPGPIFFIQKRVGINGRIFRIIKFRTMTINPYREARQTTLSDPDVFAVGRALRRSKIDELPQLFNVIMGEMSLVGPRPCLEQTFREMPNWAKRRVDVRPGITGQAQVNGNVFLSWEERWAYDIEYISNISLGRDLKIMYRTIRLLFVGEEALRSKR